MPSWIDALLVFCVTGLAGFVQTLTGFGFGMVAVPLIALVVSIDKMAVVLALPSLMLNLYLILRLRKHLRFDGFFPIMVAVIAGVPVGLLYLTSVSETLLARILGAFLVSYILWTTIRWRKPSKPLHPVFWGVPLGIASGALSGAYAMGGPPLVAFVNARNLTHLSHVAAIQILLAISGTVRLAGIGIAGLMGVPELLLGIIAAAGVVAGSTIVIAAHPNISKKILRLISIALLAIVAIRYLFFPV